MVSQIAALQEDNKTLERLKKSKEKALLDAERILQSALEKGLIIEEVQNQNFDLKRQIDIYQARFCISFFFNKYLVSIVKVKMFQPIYNYHKQEETKILEKSRRQKILEVEKLSQTIQELEEVILANGATANVVRDYQRQFSELQVSSLNFMLDKLTLCMVDLMW